MANIPIVNLNGGEFTPQIDCRADTEKYNSGCRHLENFIPRIYGGVERRPGTILVASTVNLDAVIPSILAHENSEVVHEGDILSTANSSFVPDFVCHEGEILCHENEPLTITDVMNYADTILCNDNNVLFHENEILVIGD